MSPTRETSNTYLICRLSKLDNFRFTVSAVRAFKCALVISIFIPRLNLRNKHDHAALGASPLANRLLCWIKFIGLRHSGGLHLPLYPRPMVDHCGMASTYHRA